MDKIKRYSHIIVAAIIGIAAFICIYGTGTLDVTHDTWILAKYDEGDIIQHYAGWITYRNAPWTFPLANNLHIAYPDGANIAFSDSIPIVSVFFKMLSPVLPQTFQFFGLFMLSAFILQGIAAAMLIYELTGNKIVSAISSVLFVLSPVMMERGFRHTSLAAHYIVLFAMYFYFKYRNRLKSEEDFCKLPWMPMIMLSAFSVGITPYFLPMVMIFVLVMAIDFARSRFSAKNTAVAASFFFANCAAALASGFCLGTLGQGVSSSRGGYGYYSMNLNAVINPSSLGGYTWSQFLPVRGQLFGQYDGFNYLGAGVFVFLLASIVAAIVYAVKNKAYGRFMTALKDNAVLILACIFLVMFAVSNVICFGNTVVLEIPFPEFLTDLCGIFRASSRMFWPVYYLMFAFVIVVMVKIFENRPKAVVIIIAAFLCLQVYDMKGVISEKHVQMQEKLQYQFNGPERLMQLDEYDFILENYDNNNRYVMYIAGHNNLATNAKDFNSGSYPMADKLQKEELQRIEAEPLNSRYVYVTDDKEMYKNWKERFADTAEFCQWNRNPSDSSRDLLFMLPKQ